jgi:hypothetical protein
MSVQSEKLLGIVEEMGLQAEEMAAFYKVAVGGRAVYIAKSKKVARVDLSGFDIKHPAVTRLSESEAKELKLGKVRGQINFEKTEDRVLEAFRTSLEMMKHLAEVPAEETGPTPTLAKSANRRNRKKAITKKAKGRAARKPSDLTTSSGAEA